MSAPKRFSRGTKERTTLLILKRQRYGTHICWLAHRTAHTAVAHLLDADGGVANGMKPEYQRLFYLFSP